jgi:predicted ATP-dependent protease
MTSEKEIMINNNNNRDKKGFADKLSAKCDKQFFVQAGWPIRSKLLGSIRFERSVGLECELIGVESAGLITKYEAWQ